MDSLGELTMYFYCCFEISARHGSKIHLGEDAKLEMVLHAEVSVEATKMNDYKLFNFDRMNELVYPIPIHCPEVWGTCDFLFYAMVFCTPAIVRKYSKQRLQLYAIVETLFTLILIL